MLMVFVLVTSCYLREEDIYALLWVSDTATTLQSNFTDMCMGTTPHLKAEHTLPVPPGS